MISVVGYGSLLSEASARETVPALEAHRLVRVPGFRRIFNKVGVVFITRHGQSPQSRELASCSTEPATECCIIGAQFECPEEDFAALYEREHRYRWIEVETEALTGGERSLARMCTGYSDHEYRLNKCITASEYHRRVGQYYDGALWRDDIVPFPRYLRFCLQAAATHGREVLDNFLDTSYLADGKTSIREYLLDKPHLHPDPELLPRGYSYE